MSKADEDDEGLEEIPGLGLALEGGKKFGEALEKRESKVVDARTVQSSSKLQKNVQTWVRKAAIADGKFDKHLANVMNKGDRFLNGGKIGRAYASGVNKAANSKAGRYIAETSNKLTSKTVTAYKNKVANMLAGRAAKKTAAKVAEKTVEKTVAKSASKAITKIVGKACGKSLLKKIPLFSVAIGVYYMIGRLKHKEYWCAAGELGSGIAGCWPGVGSAIGVLLDAGMGVYDVNEFIAQNKVNAGSEYIKPVKLSARTYQEIFKNYSQEKRLESVQPVVVPSNHIAAIRAKERA